MWKAFKAPTKTRNHRPPPTSNSSKIYYSAFFILFLSAISLSHILSCSSTSYFPFRSSRPLFAQLVSISPLLQIILEGKTMAKVRQLHAESRGLIYQGWVNSNKIRVIRITSFPLHAAITHLHYIKSLSSHCTSLSRTCTTQIISPNFTLICLHALHV